jgi:hypothetical protein
LFIAALVHNMLALLLVLAPNYVCVASGADNPPAVFLEIAYNAFGAGSSKDVGADA